MWDGSGLEQSVVFGVDLMERHVSYRWALEGRVRKRYSQTQTSAQKRDLLHIVPEGAGVWPWTKAPVTSSSQEPIRRPPHLRHHQTGRFPHMLNDCLTVWILSAFHFLPAVLPLTPSPNIFALSNRPVLSFLNCNYLWIIWWSLLL